MPGDLAFVSIDDMIADQADPPLSAVALPFEEMGRQVGRRLLEAERQVEADRRVGPAARGAGPVPLQQICLQPYLVRRTAPGLVPDPADPTAGPPRYASVTSGVEA